MFASHEKRVVPIGDYSVTIQKLSGRNLARAIEARQISVGKTTSALGAEMIKAFRETALADPTPKASKTKEELREERYTSYDRDTVLALGIYSWQGPDSKLTCPVPKEQIEDLDEPASATLFRAIVDLSDPAPDEIERAEKNVSRPSTVS